MLTIKNRALFFGCFVVLLAWICGCTPRGPKAVLDGKRLVEQGKFERAIERLKLGTSLVGTNANAWNYLGMAYQGAGQFTNAVNAYQRALALDYDLAEARYNLGCLYLEQNKLDPAKAQFTTFTMRRPQAVDGWLKLGTVQLRARDLAAAERSFNEALRVDAKNAEALNGLGLVSVQRNRLSDAAQQFNATLKAQPDFPPAMLNLAIVSQQQNNRRLALQLYRQYLALQPRPENWEAVSALANALERESAPAAAQGRQNPPATSAETNRAARSASTDAPREQGASPRNPDAQSSVAKPQPQPTKVVETPTAKPAETRVFETKPVEVVRVPEPATIKPAAEPVADAPSASSRPTATVPPPLPLPQTSASTERRGLFSKLNPFRRETSSSPVVTPLPSAQAIPSATQTQVTVAQTVAPTIQNSSSTKPRTSGEPKRFARYAYNNTAKPAAGNRAAAERAVAQGLQAESQKKHREAQSAFMNAVRADPSFFNAQYNLGCVAQELKDLSQALKAYEAALSIDPGSVDARYNFALTLLQANYPLDAAEELEKILAGYPNEVRAHLLLGKICGEQLGQIRRARTHYQRVLELDPGNPRGTDIRYWLAAHPA